MEENAEEPTDPLQVTGSRGVSPSRRSGAPDPAGRLGEEKLEACRAPMGQGMNAEAGLRGQVAERSGAGGCQSEGESRRSGCRSAEDGGGVGE